MLFFVSCCCCSWLVLFGWFLVVVVLCCYCLAWSSTGCIHVGSLFKNEEQKKADS